MADGIDHKYQGKFLQFSNGKWEQYNADMPGTSFLVITSAFQLQYRLDDRGLVTKKTLVLKLCDDFKYKTIEEKSFLQWRSEDKKAFGFQFQSNSEFQNFNAQLNRILNASSIEEQPKNSTHRDNDQHRNSASSSDGNSMMNEIRKENREMKQMLQMLNNKIDSLTSMLQSGGGTQKGISASAMTSQPAAHRPPPAPSSAGGRPPPPPAANVPPPPPPAPSTGSVGGGAPPPPPPGPPPPPSGGTIGGGAPPPPPPGGGGPPPPPPPPPPAGGGGGGMSLAEQLAAKKLKSADAGGGGGGAPAPPPPKPQMTMFEEMALRRQKKAQQNS